MNQEYRLDREYSIAEIIQCNLRKWWLALICAAVCAAVLGGYKYKSLKPFIEQSVYENVKQVTATLYVADYSTSASTERANNVIKMAQSYRAYELVQQKTGYDLDYKTYQGIFDVLQGEAGDMVTIYLQYPIDTGTFSIADEDGAIAFTQEIIDATLQVGSELTGGETCFTVLDAPYPNSETRKANEEEVYKKLALFLKEKQGGADHKGVSVNCMPVGYFKKDAGLKLAMSFANEKKKTLLIDLVKEPEGKEAGNSISRYVLGDESRPVPTTQNSYLDVLCRDVAEEKNFDVVMNERFASYVKEMQDTYEYIVINSPNVAESADAFAAGKLCDKNFVVCARGGVNNETLYRLKNEAAVQGIVLEGVLVYEL